MLTRNLTRTGLSLILVSGIALAGCGARVAVPPSVPSSGSGTPAASTGSAQPASSSASDQVRLADFLPVNSTYLDLAGNTVRWQVTRSGDTLTVTESHGDSKVGVVYTLQVKDGALVQMKIGNTGSVQMDRQRTWLAVPLKSFSSDYQTEDARVREQVTEEWTNSEEFGKLLHVHIVRSFSQGGTFTVDEYYKAGSGLFSRQVKDKDGRVVDKLNRISELQP